MEHKRKRNLYEVVRYCKSEFDAKEKLWGWTFGDGGSCCCKIRKERAMPSIVPSWYYSCMPKHANSN